MHLQSVIRNTQTGLAAHSSVYVPSLNSIITFGGQGRTSMINGLFNQRQYFGYSKVDVKQELWMLDLATLTWTQGPSAPALGRYGQSAVYLLGYLVGYVCVYVMHLCVVEKR